MYEMKIFSMFYYVIETKQILYISNFNHKLYPITFRCTFVIPIAFLADVNISRPKINSLNLNLSSTASITTYDAVLLFGIYQQKTVGVSETTSQILFPTTINTEFYYKVVTTREFPTRTMTVASYFTMNTNSIKMKAKKVVNITYTSSFDVVKLTSVGFLTTSEKYTVLDPPFLDDVY